MAQISAGGSNGHHTFYLNVNETNVDKTNNRSTVSWSFQITGSGWDFYDIGSTIVITINGTQVYNAYAQRSYGGSGTATWASGSLNVPHNNDGSKSISFSFSYSQSTSAYYTPGNASSSGSMTLTKIARFAIMNSATNFNDEENPSFTFSNPGNATMSCWLEPKPNGEHLAERTVAGSSGTFTWDLTEEERNQLRAKCTDGNSCKCRIGLHSVLAGGSQGNSYKDMTMTIINAEPIFNNFEYEDINTTTIALTGNNKYNINGYSTIRVTIDTNNKAVAQKSATMVKYRFIIGNTTQEVNYSDSENVYIEIPNSSIGTYQVYAIDSRNNSTLVTKLSLQNIEYNPLYLDRQNSYVERDNGGIGENVNLTYRGNIWNNSFGQVTNSITLSKYEFKKTNSDTWITGTTNISPTIFENGFSFSDLVRSDEVGYIFPVQDSYDFRITLEDELSSTIVELTSLPSGIPNISLNKNGVGIMCDYDEQLGGLLQVGGEVYNNNKVVAEYEVTGTNENTITLDNLNLKKNKTYLFKIVGSATSNSDIYWRFNDITASTYYSEGFYATSQATTGDASMGLTAGYRPRKTYFYYALHITTNYSIIEGKITLYPNLNNGNYYPSMRWSTRNLWEGYQNFSEVFGVLGTAVDNIHKIYMALANGYFRKGTKIQIVEENKYTIM